MLLACMASSGLLYPVLSLVRNQKKRKRFSPLTMKHKVETQTNVGCSLELAEKFLVTFPSLVVNITALVCSEPS